MSEREWERGREGMSTEDRKEWSGREKGEKL